MQNKPFKCKNRPGLFSAVELSNDTVSVGPQVGGKTWTLTKAEFAEEFAPVDHVFPYMKGTVTAGFIPGEVDLPCYSNGTRWNGFGTPLLDRENAVLVVKLMTSDTAEVNLALMKWDGDVILCRNDCFDEGKPLSDENQPYTRIAPENHDIDGGSVQLWAIGDGGTWYTVEDLAPALGGPAT